MLSSNAGMQAVDLVRELRYRGLSQQQACLFLDSCPPVSLQVWCVSAAASSACLVMDIMWPLTSRRACRRLTSWLMRLTLLVPPSDVMSLLLAAKRHCLVHTCCTSCRLATHNHAL